jgi:4-aminobutyrate aminotransferase-like enzyme
MVTNDVEALKQEAASRITFQGTPRAWLAEQGPWLLERGEGAYLYDADGRQFLDVMSGGVFAVLAGYGREEIARAMYDRPGSSTSRALTPVPARLQSSSRASTTRQPGRVGATR